jgi:hypothetical protein
MNYAIIPERAISATSFWVVTGETFVALSLATGTLPSLGGYTCGILLIGFSVAILVNLSRQREIDCGCGAGSGKSISWQHIYINLVLTFLALMVALYPSLAMTLINVGGIHNISIPHGSAPYVVISTGLYLVLGRAIYIYFNVRKDLNNLFSRQFERAR